VRARTAYGDTTRPARYAFTVLPPWYRTGWAYALYVLLALGLGAAAVQWRTRRLRRRQEGLEQTVADRTAQIREKNDRLAKQAERLQELDEAKSRFFANVSHEFRTPLTLIQGPVQELRDRLRRGTLEPQEDAERLALVERNVGRLQRLIDQILGLARLDASTYQLDARPTDLPGETERIARRFEPLAERHDLTLTVERPDEPPADAEPVYVDPEALEHVVDNLLSNAIKFTPEGGTVTITVEETAEGAAIRVQDTGPGIAERFPRTSPDHSACRTPTYPESRHRALARLGTTGQCLADRYDGDTLLVVGHGITVQGVLRGLIGIPKAFGTDPGCPLASLTKASGAGDDWSIHLRNDTSHLENGARAAERLV
jgi:signal transduction histidine kinase